MKKVIGLVLSFTFIFSLFSFSVCAYDYMSPPEPRAANGWHEVSSEGFGPIMYYSRSEYTYDSSGRVLTRMDYMGDEVEEEGSLTCYTYDENGRLSTVTSYQGATTDSQKYGGYSYVYRDDGTYVMIADGWTDLTSIPYSPLHDYYYGIWKYEFEGGLVKKRTPDYDLDNNSYYKNTYWTYSYSFDSEGRVTNIINECWIQSEDTFEKSQNDSYITTFTYDSDGGYTQRDIYDGGSYEKFVFNADTQLVSYSWIDKMDPEYSFTYCYEYDDAGNNTAIVSDEKAHWIHTYEKNPTETPEIAISYSMYTKSVTITSNVAYSDATIVVATYNNQKLVDLKLKKANIKTGNTGINFNEISYDSADTIKIFAWENEKSMKPICRSYVQSISR